MFYSITLTLLCTIVLLVVTAMTFVITMMIFATATIVVPVFIAIVLLASGSVAIYHEFWKGESQ